MAILHMEPGMLISCKDLPPALANPPILVPLPSDEQSLIEQYLATRLA